MCECKVRVHFQRFPTLLYRFVIEVSNAQCIRQVRADDEGKRIQAFSFSQFEDTLATASHHDQMPGIPVMSRGIAWIERNCPLVFLVGPRQMPARCGPRQGYRPKPAPWSRPPSCPRRSNPAKRRRKGSLMAAPPRSGSWTRSSSRGRESKTIDFEDPKPQTPGWVFGLHGKPWSLLSPNLACHASGG